MISCIGFKMVSKYVEVFLGKNHSKCLSYTGECHIYTKQGSALKKSNLGHFPMRKWPTKWL